MKKEKRIPTILGLVLLVGTIYLTTQLLNSPKGTSIKASQSCDPINPQITNKTNTSATISFTTSDNCSSSLNINNFTYQNSKPKGKVHYYEVDKLEADKNYQFVIISDGKKYESNDYIFKTAQKPGTVIPVSNLAWGKVFTPENSPADNAIVYLNIPGASPLSALVTTSGHWNISLAVSFNEGLTDWFYLPNNIEEDIVVIAPNYPSTQIVSNTSRNNPVPDIILGQNNFSSPSAIEMPEVSTGSLINNDINLVQDQPLKILNPKTNESINSLKPDIFGTANPNSQLKIKIESPVVYNDVIKVDSNGEWNWSPSQDLTPGEHTVTVTDENNNKISQRFIVLAAEASSPAFSASSSANLTTKTPSPTPTKIITTTPTKNPTTITPTKKITPTEIPATYPSTASGIPKTGTILPTFTLIILSFISLVFGLVSLKKF